MNAQTAKLALFRSIILFRLFNAITGQLADCAYINYGHIVEPIGSKFCTSIEYETVIVPTVNYSSYSYYTLCESGTPYRYQFSATDCTGQYSKEDAFSYYSNLGLSVSDYSCSANTCENYIHYSLFQSSQCGYTDEVDNRYTTYRVTSHCGASGYDYYTFQCDSTALYQQDYYSSDCSGYIKNQTEIPQISGCFDIYECSQSILQCGIIEVDDTYHVGDVFEDTTGIIGDICDSVGGIILGNLLSPVGLLCDSVAFLDSVCNLFEISSCEERRDTIVASCWSSNSFAYGSISTPDAFQRYLSNEYNISARYESTTSVTDELYQQTEVYLDNCGSLDNYWIAGVYDSTDNGEQNDIVSDVVEYLVNQGIADAENAVGGVSSYDQQEQMGVKFTDVVRSKRGLLLHYDEMDYLDTTYGIYFCEFNVVGADESASYSIFRMCHYYLQFALCILLLLVC